MLALRSSRLATCSTRYETPARAESRSLRQQTRLRPRRSRICCLSPRVGFWVRGPRLRRGGEVVGERRVGLDGDDLVVLGPYLREQREQELASLGGLVLGVPEARAKSSRMACARSRSGLVGGFARCSSSSSIWRRMAYRGLVISPMT
jgi:hypothetical protein